MERPLERGQAVVISARSYDDFANGKGAVEYRVGGPRNDEKTLAVLEQLRKKIELKMTVATFLAGFTFTALVELVKEPAHFKGNPNFVVGAVTALTFALAALVCAVYMYDRMAMPADFWRYKPEWVLGDREQNRNKEGHPLAKSEEVLLYDYMTWTWLKVFTPGVVLALMGFVVMLGRLAYIGWCELSWKWDASLILVAPLVAIVIVIWFYWKKRPALGTD
jgi:hypothetical protein